MSGGTLGIIIPPSIPMIIYGLVTETSVTDLFAAGVGPGLLLTVVFSIYAIWVNRHMPTRRIRLRRTGPCRARGHLGTDDAGDPAGRHLQRLLHGHRGGRGGAGVRDGGRDLRAPELKLRDFYEVVLDASKLGGSLFPVLAVALSLNIVLTEHRVPR
jgi:C4-dicarboxylate transporter DctM subunit